MKKRIVSIFVCISVMISCFAASCITSNAASERMHTPTVYLSGQGANVYAEKGNNKSDILYPPDINVSEFLKSSMVLNEPLAKGLAFNDWDDWCDTFVGLVNPLLTPFSLDKNGNASNGSGVSKTSAVKNKKAADGTFGFKDYHYSYDWRVDPCESADGLNTYIKQVKEKTGYGKINLLGRCIGANVVLAYLQKYGSDDINKVILYCAGIDGFELVGKIFTGDMYFDGDAINRFADNYLTDIDYAEDDTYSVIFDLINILNSLKTLNIAIGAFENIYDKVYQNVLPRMIIESFATMPSFWSLIGDDYYEAAKDFVFGDNKDEYSELIGKIDNYHYNVLNKTRQIIDNCKANGAQVYNVVKYGLQIVPIIKNTELQSDSMLEVVSASGGAVCSPVTKTFSKKYISEANKNGTYKYISPDKQIDASTAYLPDNTWFIKDCSHLHMPDVIDTLFAAIVDYDGYMTVFDDPDFPQYLLYTKGEETLTPLSSENSNTNSEWGIGFFRHIISLIKSLFKMLFSNIK